MPAIVDGLRYPHGRVFLPRTKLAYVNLRNLLTDAKRDRAARVSGYVAIWLPEELVLLFLQGGELVNATRTADGRSYQPIPTAEALSRVPAEPELGWICFHEADDEQLACMYTTQVRDTLAWPEEVAPNDPATLFPYLMANMFDGTIEVLADGLVNYLVVRDGNVHRSFLVHRHAGSDSEKIARTFVTESKRPPLVRGWPVATPLPAQAAPALTQAYRDLVLGVVARLVEAGGDSAPAVAEHARVSLLEMHPVLDSFSVNGRSRRDPVADAGSVTAGVAAWISETLWTAMGHDAPPPERLLAELTRDRRHMFQSAGLYDRLPWRVEW